MPVEEKDLDAELKQMSYEELLALYKKLNLDHEQVANARKEMRQTKASKPSKPSHKVGEVEMSKEMVEEMTTEQRDALYSSMNASGLTIKLI